MSVAETRLGNAVIEELDLPGWIYARITPVNPSRRIAPLLGLGS